MSETHYIYGLFDSITGECRYIGRTNNLGSRLSAHMSDARARMNSFYPSPKELWLIFCMNNGYMPFVEVLEECDESDAVDRENFWIHLVLDHGDRLTNVHILESGEILNKDYSYHLRTNTRAKRQGFGIKGVSKNYNGFPLVKPKQNYLDKLKGV